MPAGEVNYVHEAEIWRQQLKNEVEGAAVWHGNWGFLTGKEQSAPRGFSSNVAKYSYGPSKWSVKSVRVPDNSAEGIAAATSEQDARKMMSKLKWDTVPPGTTKACEAKGVTLVADETKGVESREAALLMRSHKFQSLGDACLTDGVDPGVKVRPQPRTLSILFVMLAAPHRHIDRALYGSRHPIVRALLTPTARALPRSTMRRCSRRTSTAGARPRRATRARPLRCLASRSTRRRAS